VPARTGAGYRPADPAAWYTFDAAEALGQDSSAHGRHAEVSGAKYVRFGTDGALELEGTGGLKLDHAQLPPLRYGFALDCRIRFADIAQEATIASKEGEFLLRLDPAGEERYISFFVCLNGSLEPRLRSIIPACGPWYRLVASWNGRELFLWVNGQSFRRPRNGGYQPTDRPLLIGAPSERGSPGLQGWMGEFKLYDHPLTASEIVLGEYEGPAAPVGEKVTKTAFEFQESTEGWIGLETDPVQIEQGELRTHTRGSTSVLVNRPLEVPIGGPAFASVRLAASSGQQGQLFFWTTEGIREVSFPLKADGRMHSYVFPLDGYAEWAGALTTLGLFPSDEASSVALDFVRIGPEVSAPPEGEVTAFYLEKGFNRAGRPCRVLTTLRNVGGPSRELTAALLPPDGVEVLGEQEQPLGPLGYGEARGLSWSVRSDRALTAELTLVVAGAGLTETRATLPLRLAPPVDLPPADYVPAPQRVASRRLVGAHYCPLWKEGSRRGGWDEIAPFPNREPLLGWYDEGDPEVADWEIKWGLEHGIDFFVYCWYRVNQGKPVEMFLSHAIHEGLFQSRYGSQFKFAIMWENQRRGISGVASEEDLMTNLFPFWLETYFKHPSYLVIDNKPLLFIYRPEYLVEDLGSVENVRRGLDQMREACRQAGFAGLTVLGEYRGTAPAPLALMAQEGLDYSFSYCWPLPHKTPPEEAGKRHEDIWQKRKEMNLIPDILTVSMGWDATPWGNPAYQWRVPPAYFEEVCRRADAFMDTLPAESLGSQIVLLDNWNEFGEGHYIAPHREFGFGYLDAVRRVFCDAPEEHLDLVPEDVGLGPYDRLYRAQLAQRQRCARQVRRPGAEEPGLIAWWTFDQADGEEVVLDYSGHGLGGLLEKASRVESPWGQALLCTGGSVTVPAHPLLTPDRGITIEGWLKTEVAEQNDKWFLNRIYGGATDTGYRFGLSEGKLTWAIPQTDWSHHLRADRPLPVGEWVHVAATYDGQVMRIYMNGAECGSLERRGRIHPNDKPLCLGNYDTGHAAFFNGLLDEVKLYDRALSAEIIRGHYEEGLR